jgi:hypothetical protein
VHFDRKCFGTSDLAAVLLLDTTVLCCSSPRSRFGLSELRSVFDWFDVETHSMLVDIYQDDGIDYVK